MTAAARWGLRIAAVIVAILLVLAGFVAWLFLTSSGARFALDRATRIAGGGITYEGVEGSLGGPMRIAVLEVDRPGLYARVEGLEMDASPMSPLRGAMVVHKLAARSVLLRTLDTGEAARIPASFAPPYPVRLEDGVVGELRVGALPPEAAKEKDPAKRRAMLAGAREGDHVVRGMRLRGEGDERRWKVDEARAETAFGSGRLSGTLQTGSPFALDATIVAEGKAGERPYQAEVVAKGTLKSLEARFKGSVSGQAATGRALLEPFAPTPLRALDLKASGVDLSAHVPEAPKTRLALDIALAAAGQGTYAGPVRIENAQPGPWDRGQLPFEAASARVVARADRIDVADLQVALRGGGFAGGRAVVQRGGIEADLAVKDIDLAALHGGLQKTKVTGRIVASGDRAAQRFEVNLKDPRFAIAGEGALANARLDVKTATVRTGGGAVTATGHVELEGARPFRFEGRAEHFDPSAFVKGEKGDLNFAFVASGTAGKAMAGEAKLKLAPSRYAGLALQGRVEVAGDRSRLARADVDLAVGGGRVQAKGSFGRAGDALDVAFDAPNLSTLAKPFGVALSGSAKGDGRLTGTFQSPAGRIAFTGANLALPSNVFVREIAARVEAGADPSSPIDGSVKASGIAIGEERPPTPLAQTLEATLKGTRADHRLEAAAVMRRDTSVRAAFAGGIDPRARAFAWNGRVESLAMTGRGAFALLQPATLAVSASRIELGDAQLRGEWGAARLAVTRWTPRTLDLKGSTAGVQVQNVARSLRLGVPRSNLVIAADWDVRAAEHFEGSVNLRRVSGDLRVGEPPLPLGLRELTLRLDAVRSRVQAAVAIEGERAGRIRGEGTGVLARGKSGWEFAADAPLQAKLTAVHTQLETLTPWLGPDSRLGGQLNAEVTVSGTGARPRIAGVARATNLVAREPQTGFELENGTIAVRLDGSKLAIEQFTATTPWRPTAAALERMRRVEVPPQGGRITGEGAIDLEGRAGALAIRLDKVPVTQISTRFVAMSGEARLEAGENGLLASGGFKVDAGWIGAPDEAMPTVSEDVTVVRAAQPAPVAGEEPPKETVRLDLRFDLGPRLYFQGLGLDTRLAGEVHLTGIVGSALRAKGTIRTVGGTYDGYGQKLSIERGVLTLNGPLDNPQLNVLALRKGLPVEAGVEVLGTLIRPKVRLVSVPEVPEPEKLSWLVLGRGAADASLGDSAVMMAAARALLGGSNPGSDLTKKLGFDEIKIGRADANSVLGVLPQSTVAGRTGSPSAAEVVSVGRRINNALHLTYEQGLADAEGALKLTWRFSRQFQLIARAGYLPGVDAVYRWTFR
jgi:translocation and assembly module TamB